MTTPQTQRIGYIGVDVLNNATVCNEASGLLAAGVPLEVVSVHRHDRPTFYQDQSLDTLQKSVTHLFPLCLFEAARAVLTAPFVYGRRFWTMLGNAAFGPAEGARQRITLVVQILPALILAARWRNRSIGHIHAHWAHTATSVAMHAAELLGVGFSFTGHANDLFVHRVALVAKVRRARFIVCISEYHRQFYIRLGAEPLRLKVVYCGIDTERFTSAPKAVKSARPRIVSVGRLVEKKGFHDLIAACAVLREAGHDFECVIAGSGPEQAKLVAEITTLRLEGVVTVTGRTVLQEDLPGLLGTAEVFALPCVRDRDGDMDGLPQVIIEALLCGVPTVSTELVGIPDIIRDGQTGLLVSPGDVAALADAIGLLLTTPELAQRLGTQGREWALSHFGLDEAVSRLERLFLTAAREPGTGALAIEMPSSIAETRSAHPKLRSEISVP